MSDENDSYGYYDTVGNNNACAWRNGPGCIKIQFRDPVLSRKFQRSGIRSVWVDIGVDGGATSGSSPSKAKLLVGSNAG